MPPADEFNIPPRDMYQLFEGLRSEIASLTVKLSTVQSELEQTRTDMRAYNGLRKRLECVEAAQAAAIAQGQGRRQVLTGAQAALGLGLAVAGFVCGIVLR